MWTISLHHIRVQNKAHALRWLTRKPIFFTVELLANKMPVHAHTEKPLWSFKNHVWMCSILFPYPYCMCVTPNAITSLKDQVTSHQVTAPQWPHLNKDYLPSTIHLSWNAQAGAHTHTPFLHAFNHTDGMGKLSMISHGGSTWQSGNKTKRFHVAKSSTFSSLSHTLCILFSLPLLHFILLSPKKIPPHSLSILSLFWDKEWWITAELKLTLDQQPQCRGRITAEKC